MSSSSRASLFVALALALGQAHANTITYSGYIVDFYCLRLMDSRGRAFDGSDVRRAPWQHTLHCLRDPPPCRQGYYLAERGDDGEYRQKFGLDGASHEAALALMDSFPKGSDRDSRAFAITAVGTHDGDGILRGATFSTCFESTGCDSVCVASDNSTQACDTPAGLILRAPARGLLIAHVVCMCLSWGCLLPLGVLWARNMRTSEWKPGGVPAWFQGHRTIQSVGVALQIVGFVCIIVHKWSLEHFKDSHEILGLAVVVLGCLQPVNAMVRHLPCIGHPRPDGSRTTARAVWEFYHKGCGWLCLVGGVANVVFGPIFANTLRFSSALVIGSAVFLGISLGVLVVGGLLLEVKRLLSGPASKKTDEEVVPASKTDEEAGNRTEN